MRRLLTISVLLAVLAGPALCLGQGQGGYPVTIDHEYGRTVLEAMPERIVSLEPGLITDTLIALGHPPVASTAYGIGDPDADGFWPPAIQEQALALGIRPIGTASEPSLEAIALLKPDLIIGYPWHAATLYGRLSLIAPTLVVPDVRDFRPPLRQIARALGANERAEALVGELQQLQDEIRQAHGGTDIAIVRPRQFSTWLYGPPSNAGRLLSEAGLRVVVPVNEASVTPDSPGAIHDLSLERVPGAQADFLFFILYNLDEPLTKYLRHPVWQRNAAIAEGRAAGVQGIAWTNHGPLGALAMLREAKRALDTQAMQ
ncbi:MAG: iron-siderophore ABC transporter substrate-binding protein [Marinobacter sp.]|uniref:iron-siderophore ABC transporter substrate-binding protein n=1 Tax=Marinobacter sp. TaxID=50741 RepID=UPI00299EB4EE|nr:iron-siderophore ABC transporter substrate-binding protein [Marinobacter sp.]MDX1635194.1 iron-siderophore ABC transporter substrate-binding protein [Marinobacter sp.]